MMRERARERPERARESQRELHYEPTPHLIPLWYKEKLLPNLKLFIYVCINTEIQDHNWSFLCLFRKENAYKGNRPVDTRQVVLKPIFDSNDTKPWVWISLTHTVLNHVHWVPSQVFLWQMFAEDASTSRWDRQTLSQRPGKAVRINVMSFASSFLTSITIIIIITSVTIIINISIMINLEEWCTSRLQPVLEAALALENCTFL